MRPTTQRSTRPPARLAAVLAAATLLAACSSAATQAPDRGTLPVNQPRPAGTFAPAATAAPAVPGSTSTETGRTSGPGDALFSGGGSTPAASAAPANAQEPGKANPTAGPAERPQPSPDTTFFEGAGINPYVDTREDSLSTFALDVDTASYTLAKTWIESGSLPAAESVRVEEWVNAFDMAYPSPEEGVFGIFTDGGTADFVTGERDGREVLLRIGIQARDVARRERPAASLTFVIDTSGSMARDDRLELVKDSLSLLVDQLRETDRVAIVAFSTEARVVLSPTWASDRATIRGAIAELQPENSTNAEAGLRLGYGLAREAFAEGGINRVIIASDGVANVGNTDSETILSEVRRDAQIGIQLVSVGVGLGNYNDVLLEQLADKGDGFYAYVNGPDEAHKLFVENLVSTIDTVALDAKSQVAFDPSNVDAYRLIGYENRDVADSDFRNNHVDAGAIGAGHSVTALYGLRLRPGVEGGDRLATVTIRWTDPETNRVSEISRSIGRHDLASSWRETSPTFKLAALVAAAAETFRGSPFIADYSIRDLARAASSIRNDLPRTDEVDAFLRMLSDAASLR